MTLTNIIHGTTDTAMRCESGPGGDRCPPCALRWQKVKVANGVQHKREAAATEQATKERRAKLRRGS